MRQCEARKIAVVLLNLGGPDSPQAVRPFLYNLFSDPAIISLPWPFRNLFASIISRKREKEAQQIYAQIGGRSPILEETKTQAEALEEKLNASREQDYKVFIAMRYWHPFTEEACEAVKNFQPDKIILLPLYPQFSTTTTASSFEKWKKKIEGNYRAISHLVCCYPEDGAFIKAHTELIRLHYEKAQKLGKVRLLFSAHGLPKKVIEKGDPYQWQVEQTAKAIVNELQLEDLDWQVCYQSKVGPLEWIGPSTDEEIIRAAEEGLAIVVVPIAFVSEHSETLVELDVQYRNLAIDKGVMAYGRVPALGNNEQFIKALARKVEDVITISEEKQHRGLCNKRICPVKFSGCPNVG